MAACCFFNVRTDVDTCDCTLGLYCKHGKAKSKTVTWVRESACSERWLWAVWSISLPTELSWRAWFLSALCLSLRLWLTLPTTVPVWLGRVKFLAEMLFLEQDYSVSVSNGQQVPPCHFSKAAALSTFKRVLQNIWGEYVCRSLRLKDVAISNRLPGTVPEDKVAGVVKDNGQTKLWAQSQGCHLVNCPKERDAEGRSTWRSSLNLHDEKGPLSETPRLEWFQGCSLYLSFTEIELNWMDLISEHITWGSMLIF